MLPARAHNDSIHTRDPSTQDLTSPNKPHFSVPKVHAIPPNDHNATSRTTGTPNLSDYANDNTQGTQPMTHNDYHANDSPQLTHNALNTSPEARSHNRPGQDSAPQAEHSSARRQPSNCCETSSQMLTATDSSTEIQATQGTQ